MEKSVVIVNKECHVRQKIDKKNYWTKQFHQSFVHVLCSSHAEGLKNTIKVKSVNILLVNSMYEKYHTTQSHFSEICQTFWGNKLQTFNNISKFLPTCHQHFQWRNQAHTCIFPAWPLSTSMQRTAAFPLA